MLLSQVTANKDTKFPHNQGFVIDPLWVHDPPVGTCGLDQIVLNFNNFIPHWIYEWNVTAL